MRNRSKIANGGREVSPVFFLFLLALPLLLLFAALFGLVVFLVTLPFRIVGFAFHLLGAVLALPLLALLGVAVFGALAFAAVVGLFALAVPVLPFVLLLLGGIWLVKRLARRPAVA